MKQKPTPSFEYDPQKGEIIHSQITADSEAKLALESEVVQPHKQNASSNAGPAVATETSDHKANKSSEFKRKKHHKKGEPQPHYQDKIMSDDFSDLYKPKKRRWPKVLLVLFMLLLAIAAAAGWYIYSHAAKISTNPFDFSSQLKGESDGRVNILLLGIGDPGHAGETLADTNMVVSINTKTQPAEVVMLGIPRDLRVEIPSEGFKKINEAHALGENQKPPKGIEVATETVEENLGIPIHYYVRANFTGLKQAVDAVGGIEVDVPEALNDPEYPCDKNEARICGFKLKAGPQKLDGATALKYARCRKGNCGDDFGRSIRQQQVLTAIREKVLAADTLANPARINELLGAASNNAKTDLSLRNLQRLAELTKGLESKDITSVVLSLKPNGFLVSSKTSSDLVPSSGSFAQIQKFVENIFVLAPIMKEESILNILNGTTKANLSTKLKTQLEKDAVPILQYLTGNAKTTTNTTSQIIDYSGGTKPKTAEYLAKLLGVGVVTPEKPGKPTNADFEITLGLDYFNSLTGSAAKP